MTLITLACNENVVRLSPEAGGGICEFRHAGMEVLRTAAPEAIEARDPLGLSCFPMTPFVNRIRNGRFAFEGVQVDFQQPPLKHPLHGQGWRLPWRVIEHDEISAVIELEAGGDAWPWRYRTRQYFTLSSKGLTVVMELENTSEGAMPCSLGLHPYFPDLSVASLKARTSGMWATDEELMPVDWRPSGQAPAFDDFQRLAGSDLDNCFTGFDGEAVIRWADGRQIRMLSEGCRFLQVYTRGSDGSFCVEAQTAAPDALNRIGDVEGGTTVLAPGETLSCTTRFVVEAA